MNPPGPSSAALLERIAHELDLKLLGKQKAVRSALTALVARGHLLLEDIPGLGKTTLAESLARVFGLTFSRIQFTADLLPADIVGVQIYRQGTGEFEFRQGPIFGQLVLADELNRAPPRTQSALLEAMAQSQVSVDGRTYPLPQPFAVVATQNPLELSGTYPIPDAQLDRFLFRLSLGHLAPEDELKLLSERTGNTPAPTKAVATPEMLKALQRAADAVELSTEIADYAVRIGTETRRHPALERGASTRAMLTLAAAARAQALWSDRPFVSPGDLRAVAIPCLAHRIILRDPPRGSAVRDAATRILEEILQSVPSPR